jgi:3-hydroxybutyryl-CoA dehydrogenase
MEINTHEIPVGVVGLGLMGCSITTCFLMSGHPVIAIAPISDDLKHAESRIRHHLQKSFEEELTTERPEFYFRNLLISENYDDLKDCRLVVECTLENEAIKKSVYEKIESVIANDALLASNTSAIPISILQRLTKRPQLFVGLHWSEPSHTTRFLEIICGELSDIEKAEYLYELSHYWQKEPTLVRKDIRGFITNRLMYAMYREAFHLVENGYATVEDVDRACRNNAGYWMTLVGLFRWMDLTGVAAYHNVMKDLFPTLTNNTEVPKLIDDIVKAGGRGVSNAHGFYEYTPEEAKMWEETYSDFCYDIRKIALKYPADVVKKRMAGKEKDKR